MSKASRTILLIFGLAVIGISVFELSGQFIASRQPAAVFDWQKPVDIYLVSSEKARTSSCEADVPVRRTVLNAETLGPGALEALIQGPLDSERASLFSAINSDALVQRFEVKNRTAYVDFNHRLNEGVAGSCTVIAIRSAIENTLKALPDIDNVVISVNGETEGILEP